MQSITPRAVQRQPPRDPPLALLHSFEHICYFAVQSITRWVSRMLQLIQHRHVTFGTLLQWSTAAAVAGVGVLGQISDAPDNPYHGSSADLHAAFGVLLCVAVMTRFHCGLWRLGDTDPDTIALFSRRLRRLVYLLLYALIGVKELGRLGQPLAPLEAFQTYLVCGILALFLIHALASASVWRCASRKPPVRTPQASMAARTRELNKAASSSA